MLSVTSFDLQLQAQAVPETAPPSPSIGSVPVYVPGQAAPPMMPTLSTIADAQDEDVVQEKGDPNFGPHINHTRKMYKNASKDTDKALEKLRECQKSKNGSVNQRNTAKKELDEALKASRIKQAEAEQAKSNYDLKKANFNHSDTVVKESRKEEEKAYTFYKDMEDKAETLQDTARAFEKANGGGEEAFSTMQHYEFRLMFQAGYCEELSYEPLTHTSHLARVPSKSLREALRCWADYGLKKNGPVMTLLTEKGLEIRTSNNADHDVLVPVMSVVMDLDDDSEPHDTQARKRSRQD